MDTWDEGVPTSTFEKVSEYFRDDKDQSRYVFHYNKIKNCEKCTGSNKVDTYDMIIKGVGNVKWGSKSAKKCLSLTKHAFLGVKNDPMITNVSHVAQCVAWKKMDKNKNCKTWNTCEQTNNL